MKANRQILAIFLTSSLLGFCLPARASLDLVRTEFELKLAQVDQKVEVGLTKLNAAYLKQLDAFEAKSMKGGDLNRTLVFRKEKERFLSARTVDTVYMSKDPDLNRLQKWFLGHYNKADGLRSGESSKLIKQYLVDLGDLSTQLTKDGKIQEAIAVKTEKDETALRYADTLASVNKPVVRPGGGRQPAQARPSRSLKQFTTRFPHLASNLKVYYDFEDPSGAVDLMGNVNGTLKSVSNTESGHKGRGLNFDGSGKVSLGKPSTLTGLNEATICFWMKTTKAGGTVASSFTRSSRTGFRIGVGSDGKVQAALGYDSSYYSSGGSYGKVNTARSNRATSKKPVNDGRWHHVAMVKDAKKIYIYVDGEKGSSSYTERRLMDSSADFRLSGYSYYSSDSDGGYSDYSSYVGQLDDFMVFNKPMTDQMVKSLCTSQR